LATVDWMTAGATTGAEIAGVGIDVADVALD
jgi:hypothetical protein